MLWAGPARPWALVTGAAAATPAPSSAAAIRQPRIRPGNNSIENASAEPELIWTILHAKFVKFLFKNSY
jgi:hypothetical protein